MIETSLKRELMSIEYIWQRHGVDLSADPVVDTSNITEDDNDASITPKKKRSSRHLKADDLSFEIFDMETFSETDDESSQLDGSVTCDITESDCESTIDYIVPIRELEPMEEVSHDRLEKRDAFCQTVADDVVDGLAGSLCGAEHSILGHDGVTTTTLLHRIVALQEELESTKDELAALKKHVNGTPRKLTREEAWTLQCLGRRTHSIIKGAAVVGALTFGSLIVLSTVQRRPMGCGHGFRL